MKFWSYTDFHWVARTCTTTAYRWLFRGSRPSLRILCSAVVKSQYFSVRRIDLCWFLRKQAWTLCFRFCLHFWSVAFRIWVHSFRGMCEHMYSRSSRLAVKGCKPNKNALRWIFLVHLVCLFTVPRGLLVMIWQHRFPACMLVTSSRDWIW